MRNSSKRARNDVRMQRLEGAVKSILAAPEAYVRDYKAFWAKQGRGSLTESEQLSAAFSFSRKWILRPQPIEMINAIFNHGEASNWSYESCGHLVTRTLSHAFLDDECIMGRDGKIQFNYAPDEFGFARFWIDISPNTPRNLIHRTLDEELDRLQKKIKTGQVKPRQRQEKLGGLAILAKVVNEGKPIDQAAGELGINMELAKQRVGSTNRRLGVKPKAKKPGKLGARQEGLLRNPDHINKISVPPKGTDKLDVDNLLLMLTPKERKVFELYHGLTAIGESLTPDEISEHLEISEQLSITPTQVLQIAKQALQKLQSLKK